MKVTNFDKPTIKAIRLAMDNALANVAQEWGITINTGNARFSGNEVTYKVKANIVDGATGTAITKEAQAWDLYKQSIGLGHLDVGDTIQLQGKSFTITGYNTRARKSPINITDSSGRGFKCSVEMVKLYNK